MVAKEKDMGVEVDETRRGWLIPRSWLLIHKEREVMRAKVCGVELTWFECKTTTYHFECNAGLTTMDVIARFPA